MPCFITITIPKNWGIFHVNVCYWSPGQAHPRVYRPAKDVLQRTKNVAQGMRSKEKALHMEGILKVLFNQVSIYDGYSTRRVWYKRLC
jgi:hypothetical protein